MSDTPPAAAPDAASETDIDPDELQRLNAKVQLLWLVRVLVVAAVIGAIAAGAAYYFEYPVLVIGLGVAVAVAVLGIVHTLLRYRFWGFTVRDDSLYLQHGVLIRVQTVVPYVRIQHIDTSRGPLERLVGLSSSVVYTAGSRGADVTIPGLEDDRARNLQEHLKDLANAVGTDDAV